MRAISSPNLGTQRYGYDSFFFSLVKELSNPVLIPKSPTDSILHAPEVSKDLGGQHIVADRRHHNTAQRHNQPAVKHTAEIHTIDNVEDTVYRDAGNHDE